MCLWRATASYPTPSEATVQWPLSKVSLTQGPAGPSLARGCKPSLTPSMIGMTLPCPDLSDHLGNRWAQKHL